MLDQARPEMCTLGEVMIYQIARTIEDGILVFHGFGSPLVQIALHLAKRTRAPNIVLVAGATYGVNPNPPFVSPTSNDWVMDCGAECHLDIEELFDLGASGRIGRMFLSGAQIDRWGNMNVTQVGRDRLKLKLPGGGGGCNLACDVEHITIWTAAHQAPLDSKGKRRFRLVDATDFITSVGHRTADGKTRAQMQYRGKGPDWIVTEIALFDFDAEGHARLAALYPDTDVGAVMNNTDFEFPVHNELTTVVLPDLETVKFIRALDPLKVHERELRPLDCKRCFEIT